jgi:aminotransferase EvaB
MIKSWSFAKEYKSLRKNILKSIDATLKSGNIFFGNQLKQFEGNFNKLNNNKFGVAVGSGTDAILISLLALDIKAGDEVITVSNTAIPTVSAITSVGAIAKFIDIKDDYLMDEHLIEKNITRKTKAIIPVHLYGQACNMDKICYLAKKYKLKIIEDCAQAQGAKFKNKNVGTFGDAGCFSFYPTKILGAYGDGGFISVKDRILFEKVRALRFYGIDEVNKKNRFYKKYYANYHGINSRIDEIQCSILNIKIKKVNFNINKRIKLTNLYRRELKDTKLKMPIQNKDCKHVYHLFVVHHPKRDLILSELRKKNINLIINYPYPIHKMKGYSNKSIINKKLTKTEYFTKGIFSLPTYPDLDEKKLIKFTNLLKSILKKIS